MKPHQTKLIDSTKARKPDYSRAPKLSKQRDSRHDEIADSTEQVECLCNVSLSDHEKGTDGGA